jgi:diaminopimelate epimerase
MALADRRTGIGADTIVVILPPADDEADVSVRFFNADGDESPTCGNATRCIAALLFAETGRDAVRIHTPAGVLDAWRAGGDVAVDMGEARLGWWEIPVADACDTRNLPYEGALSDPVGVNMGNPHAVFFVDDAEAVDLQAIGPGIEHAPLFPMRVNVEVAELIGPNRLRMRVWERGVGITQACGSGACAALVAAVRRGLTERKGIVVLDGGELAIEWRDDGHVIMTGPAATAFTGEIDEAFLPSFAQRAQAA